MADVVDPATRSRMMAGIRGKNTKPELLVRHALHRAGFRYRLHDPGLPGKPDMTFPKHHAVIQTHGCFWHGHHCHLFKWPGSKVEFWQKKITRNREKDAENMAALAALGWRVLVVWECAIKGRTRRPLQEIVETASTWLKDGSDSLEIEGNN